MREVNELVDRGVKEVVLTAIHAADYDGGGPAEVRERYRVGRGGFSGLVRKVLAETRVPRLRLTSLDPAEIPEELLDLMATDSRLCPHFHVSLQSANDRVLGAMKRGYGAREIEERLATIAGRLPHAFVGMDVIAGFPGETDEEFEDTFQRLERLPWSRAHVFPFSVRRQTAAARLAEAGLSVPQHKVSERARRLRELSDRKFAAALEARKGSVAEILVEGKELEWEGRQVSMGHTRSYFKVIIPGRHKANELRRVRIVGRLGETRLKRGVSMKKVLLILALVSVNAAGADNGMPTQAAGPVDMVKKIFDLAGRPEVATEPAKQAEVNAFVDFDALARAALGAQAKAQPAAEFAWFRDTLKDIIGRTVYPKAPDFLSGVKITYKTSQASSAKTAKVLSSVQNKADITDVDYKLAAEKDGSWKVADVAISGQSWVDSIREQVNSVIKKKKWKGLKENMNRRLNELKAGKA